MFEMWLLDSINQLTITQSQQTITLQQLVDQIANQNSKQRDTVSISTINTKPWDTVAS